MSAGTAAGATQRVLDGSFDSLTSCSPSDCTSPVWAEGDTGVGVGPLCRIGTGSCGFFEGGSTNVYPRSGSTWLQMGGATINGSQVYTLAAQQVVNLPKSKAILAFDLMTRDSNVSSGSLIIRINGAPVTAIPANTPGFSAYARVYRNVSAYSGGLRTLRFETVINQQSNGSSDSINIDNVSLATVPLTTGKRARALKKCRKIPKSEKKKRARCFKRARKLPV